jgi:hypothetical protein
MLVPSEMGREGLEVLSLEILNERALDLSLTCKGGWLASII